MSDPEVLIVGGGISGLSVGWWLARRGIHCEIWEEKNRPGGKIRSRLANGYLTEQAASLVTNFRPEITCLIQESGLEDKKLPRPRKAEARRYLLHEGKLQALPSRPLAMLLSPLWSWRGKLRLLAEPWIPRNGSGHESVAQFISRRLGREILEKAMEPFIGGTLAADATLADARTTLPRLTALEERYGSITLGVLAHRLMRRREAATDESFSFQGGLSTLIDGLVATLPERVLTGRKAVELNRDGRFWRVNGTSATGEVTVRVRHVVLSTPAAITAALLTPLDQELGSTISTIQYAPLAVLHLGLSREQVSHPLDGSGFLTPASAGISFNGNLWMSSLFPERAPPGKVLLSSYVGGYRAPYMVDWSEERVAAAVCRDLGPILGLKGEPEWVHVDRHPQALPLYYGNHRQRLVTIEERLRRLAGLHLAANYQGGVSVRDRILCGAQIAGAIAGQLDRKWPIGRCHPYAGLQPYEDGTLSTR